MKRRNRESRSWIKLIQEKHLTKEEQRALDAILTQHNKRYSTAYDEYRNNHFFFCAYDTAVGMKRAAQAFAQAGVSASEAAKAIIEFDNAWRAALY